MVAVTEIYSAVSLYSITEKTIITATTIKQRIKVIEIIAKDAYISRYLVKHTSATSPISGKNRSANPILTFKKTPLLKK